LDENKSDTAVQMKSRPTQIKTYDLTHQDHLRAISLGNDTG